MKPPAPMDGHASRSRPAGRKLFVALLACSWAHAAAAQSSPTSLKPLPKDEWTLAAAAHLLARAGFSDTPDNVDRLHAMGIDEAVTTLVDFDDLPYTVEPPPIPADLTRRPDRAALRAMTEEQRREQEEQRRRMERVALEETRLWWIERMIRSPRSLEEKMTLFWHGHFTSGVREVRSAVYMKEQNELFRRHALGNFRELLLNVSKDRAMLTYLDGNRNDKDKPNENYARELMELFSLGVGNYTENDVKAAARAFTGWHVDDDGFVFRGRNHDYGMKTFLGKTGKWDGGDIIKIITDQPACSRYLAKGLLEFFVHPDPERKLVDALAAEIRRNDFDLKPALRTLLRSQAFYSDSARGALIKSPVELIVGTARRLGQSPRSLAAAERAMTGMGQELMQPPNVKGWDGEEKWINTATLFRRYNTTSAMIMGGDARPGSRLERAMRRMARSGPSEEDDENDEQAELSMRDMREPRSRLKDNGLPAYDPMPLLHLRKARTAEEILDLYEQYWLARPLAPAKRQQLIEYLNSGSTFALSEKGANDRVRTMLQLLCSTPEYQMN